MTTANPTSEMDDQMISEASAAARQVLGISGDTSSDTVHQSIHDFLCRQNTKSGLLRRSPAMPMGEDCPMALGALWGSEICREFGWDWIVAQQGDWTGLGVADPERRYLALALNYFEGLIHVHPEVANLPALQLYNCFKAGKFPDSVPGALTLIAHSKS
ncbi:hypothetical protein ACFQY0_20875 [Haloferula chungangensis]|uniref:Uncharacterized protein n=1 Tax=Haloferula chungangensis TaxID=1048331 RepID=A0ABW2LFT8_9BACT